MQMPGLYTQWCMCRVQSTRANSAQGEFCTHLLADRVSRFELVFAYSGLCREVICVYTILGLNVLFRESPLRSPHVRFGEDRQEVQLVEGTSAWRAMHNRFDLKLMPNLLLAEAKSEKHVL